MSQWQPIETAARSIWLKREASFPPFTRMTWEQGSALARSATIAQALGKQEPPTEAA